jgi:hypothetical protein
MWTVILSYIHSYVVYISHNESLMPIVCVSCADVFPTHLSWSLFFQKRRFSIRVYAPFPIALWLPRLEKIYIYI